MSDTRKKGAKRHDKYDRFRRSEKTIDVRPVFYIASEGKNTEPDYFAVILARLYPNIRMEIVKEEQKISAVRGNDPPKLRQRLRKLLKQIDKRIIRREAWIVVDRDEKTWTAEQLNEVAMWVEAENKKKTSVFHGIALSNPCFEFWLLLHFEEGTGALNNDKCKSMLKKKKN